MQDPEGAFPISDLQDHLGYWLRLVSNHVSHTFARNLETTGVTVAEWVFLRNLYRLGTVPPSWLAEEMGMTRGAISKLMDRLISKGLVSKNLSAQDARSFTLQLTDAGRNIVPELASLADQNDNRFFAVLTPEQKEQLQHLMQLLADRHGLKNQPID